MGVEAERPLEAFPVVQERYSVCLYKCGGRGVRSKWMDLRCVLQLVRLPRNVVTYGHGAYEGGGVSWK